MNDQITFKRLTPGQSVPRPPFRDAALVYDADGDLKLIDGDTGEKKPLSEQVVGVVAANSASPALTVTQTGSGAAGLFERSNATTRIELRRTGDPIPSGVQAGQVLFSAISPSGTVRNMALVGSYAENPSGSIIPGGLIFSTTETNLAAGTTNSMRLTPSGNFGINTTTPASKLHVAGDLTLSSATTAGAATAGAATLPANPVGFLVVNLNGTSVKMPYYAA